MKTTRWLVIPSVLFVLPLLLSLLLIAGDMKDEFSCSESNPKSICAAATTCGSASAPCRIDIKRSGQAAAGSDDPVGAKACGAGKRQAEPGEAVR
jgi:hypothetical protein